MRSVLQNVIKNNNNNNNNINENFELRIILWIWKRKENNKKEFLATYGSQISKTVMW